MVLEFTTFITYSISIADPYWQLLYIVFWGLFIVVVMFYVYRNGPEFIDTPKLVHTDKKVQ